MGELRTASVTHVGVHAMLTSSHAASSEELVFTAAHAPTPKALDAFATVLGDIQAAIIKVRGPLRLRQASRP